MLEHLYKHIFLRLAKSDKEPAEKMLELAEALEKRNLSRGAVVAFFEEALCSNRHLINKLRQAYSMADAISQAICMCMRRYALPRQSALLLVAMIASQKMRNGAGYNLVDVKHILSTLTDNIQRTAYTRLVAQGFVAPAVNKVECSIYSTVARKLPSAADLIQVWGEHIPVEVEIIRLLSKHKRVTRKNIVHQFGQAGVVAAEALTHAGKIISPEPGVYELV